MSANAKHGVYVHADRAARVDIDVPASAEVVSALEVIPTSTGEDSYTASSAAPAADVCFDVVNAPSVPLQPSRSQISLEQNSQFGASFSSHLLACTAAAADDLDEGLAQIVQGKISLIRRLYIATMAIWLQEAIARMWK